MRYDYQKMIHCEKEYMILESGGKNMFDNVGNTLKRTAERLALIILVSYVLLAGACVVAAVSCLFGGEPGGFFILLLGAGFFFILFALKLLPVFVFKIYAYGEITEKITYIEATIVQREDKPVFQPSQNEECTSNNSSDGHLTDKSKVVKNTNVNPEKYHNGSWECTCGRTNMHYVSSCACGRNKREIK